MQYEVIEINRDYDGKQDRIYPTKYTEKHTGYGLRPEDFLNTQNRTETEVQESDN